MKKFFTGLFSSARKVRKYNKYLIVPDIHGTYSIYQKVEAYIKEHDEDDRLVIFLGDYMDRGEPGEIEGKKFNDAGSFYTIRDLIKLRKWAIAKDKDMVFLRGNHEIFFENFFIDGSIRAYKQYKFFKNSVESLEYMMQRDHAFSEDFIVFLNDLTPYYLDHKNSYLFVHAGIDPKAKDLEQQAKEGIIYWIRDKFILSKQKLPYTVVFGHTPFFKPFIKPDKIGLDSGVYRSGFINLLEINGAHHKIVKLEAN